MKNLIIWVIEALLAFFASAVTVNAVQIGFANRFRKKGRQVHLGLLPRIIVAIVILATSLIAAFTAAKLPGLAVAIVILATIVWAAGMLIMLPRDVNLLGGALLAIAAHFVAEAMYAFGGNMGLWPFWFWFCLLAELILAAALLLVQVMYYFMSKNAEEFREERNQRKEEAEARNAKKKKEQQIDREVDEELLDEARDKAGVIVTALIIIMLLAITIFIVWKLELLPFI